MAQTTVALRHPRYDLRSSVAVAEKLFENGGGQAPIDALAHWLGYKSTENGAFLARIVAARLFGLVEGPPKAVRATSRAQTIIRPDYESSAIRARLEAFESVPLYNAFLQMYEGRPLPPPAGMLNTLRNNFGISEKDAGTVLDRLLESADTAGLFAVTGDRSKMIRPPLGGMAQKETAETPHTGQVVSIARDTAATEARSGMRSKGTLLDGMWEELPDGNWNEDELTYWLETFERVLRVRYKLPKSPRAG